MAIGGRVRFGSEADLIDMLDFRVGAALPGASGLGQILSRKASALLVFRNRQTTEAYAELDTLARA